MNNIVIRDAKPDDIPAILHFIKELAVYEKALDQVVATEKDLEKALFTQGSNVFALICEIDEVPIGFAIYYLTFSTWEGKHGIYLEDLFVDKAHRGRGAGKALFQYLARIAVEQKLTRFEWSVLDWNQPAIDFYESFHAKPLSEWIKYRLSDDALAACANDE